MFRRRSKKNTKKSPEEQEAETNKFNVTLLSNIYAKLLHEIVPGRELEFPLLDQRDSRIYGDLFGGGQSVTVRNFRGVIAPPPPSSSSLNQYDESHRNSTVSSSFSHDSAEVDSENKNIETRSDELEESEDERQTDSSELLEQPSESVDESSLPLNNDVPSIPSTDSSTLPEQRTLPTIPNKRVQKVIHLIHTIGELIARENIPKNISTQSPVFEYFSEKNILSFFIDIAKAKLPTSSYPTTSNLGVTSHPPPPPIPFLPYDEMVYTSSMKSQVLKTCSTLLSYAASTFDQHSDRLYFLLSHNYMNELISCFLPLQQWSDEALIEIIPHYISFIQTLAGILNTYPFLGTLLIQNCTSLDTEKDEIKEKYVSYFPIFHACIEIITSTRKILLDADDMQVTLRHVLSQLCTVSSSSSSTQMNIVLDSRQDIQTWMVYCTQDLNVWIQYLCNQVSTQYDTLTRHLVGTLYGVDEERISIIQKDIEIIQKQYRYMNDILWCRNPSLNILFCEYFLETIVYPKWLKNFTLTSTFDEVEMDCTLAQSQAAMYMIIQLFLNLDYRPLIKMVATAILHPHAPTESYFQKNKRNDTKYNEDPAYTSFLSQILRGNEEIDSTDYCTNPCRNEILRLLRGDGGDYRFICTAVLLESILESSTMDPDFLSHLNLFPPLNQEKDMFDSQDSVSTHHSYPFEDALGLFYMKRIHIATSPFTSLAMDYATSLLLCFLNHSLERINMVSTNVDQMSRRFRGSSIIRGVFVSRRLYALEAQKYQKSDSVGTKIMANLVDMEISRLYKLIKVGNESIFASDLERRSARTLKQDWRILFTTEPSLPASDIDNARMAVHMVLRLKILCKVLRELHDKFAKMVEKDGESSLGSSPTDGFLNARIVCEADGPVLNLLGGYRIRPQLGKDMEIRGKTIFTFYKPTKESTSRRNELIFLIDMDEVLILKHHLLGSSGKGTVIFISRLRDILTAAADGTCLHLAMRHPKDENEIFKNGKDHHTVCLVSFHSAYG